MLYRVLLSSKEESQRRNLFKVHCSIINKVCNLIVDSESTESLVSHKLVGHLKLPTLIHEKTYTLGWVSKSTLVRVSLTCKIRISTGKHYKEEVIYVMFLTWIFVMFYSVALGNLTLMLFKWGIYKIFMASVLDFDGSAGQEKSNFLVIGNVDEAIKKTRGFFPKGLMNNVKEEDILEELQNIFQDFEEFIADELPNALSFMRDIQH